MNAEQMIQLIGPGKIDALETEWLGAIEDKMPLEDVTLVLAALTKREKLDTAETLAQMLLEERRPQADAAELLAIAKAIVAGVPISDELRNAAADAYRAVYGDNEHFDAILTSAGLLSGQSPRRSLRTMDTCLAIVPGSYMANRFDHDVIRVAKYDDTFGEFEIADAAGHTQRMEPKELADEFDLTDEDDFRVLHQHRPGELGVLIKKEPAAVLIGVCKSSGGEINANQLRDTLVPDHMPQGRWSGWWSRARTAAKRSDQLSLSTDRPIRISYHPHGRTVEEGFSKAAARAKMPLEKLAILQQYAREVEARKGSMDVAFVTPLIEDLAAQAIKFADRRPADALAAALALKVAADLGMPAPASDSPTASAILAVASDPAEAITDLNDPALWPAALEALKARDDADAQLITLLANTPVGRLDEVAGRVGAEALTELAAKTMSEPRENLDFCLWLWKGPGVAVPGSPGKMELFRRLMAVLAELEMDLNLNSNVRRDTRQQIRTALSASDFTVFRQAVEEIDEAVAATMLNLIRRSSGLSDSVLHDMLRILREKHYTLFLIEKVKPWEDENVIWTTENALLKREDELKYLVDVKMLENAEAIGRAASFGDLSENSEWQFAIEERDLLRAQAARMQDELGRAKIIHPDEIDAGAVAIGSKVTLTRLTDGESLTLSLLGPWESDVATHTYNYQTPLALTLLGKPVGEEVTLKLSGQEATYRIEQLGSALET